MAAICDFFPSKSKRVPELEDPLADTFGPIDQFAFHRCFLGEMPVGKSIISLADIGGKTYRRRTQALATSLRISSSLI
jgi:hypothetical protein